MHRNSESRAPVNSRVKKYARGFGGQVWDTLHEPLHLFGGQKTLAPVGRVSRHVDSGIEALIDLQLMAVNLLIYLAW
jgi:hypothetical protein